MDVKFQAYEFIGSGRHRNVYRLNDREVFKVPQGPLGEGDNATEAYRFEMNGHEGVVPFAACRLDVVEGVEVLVMDYVEPLFGPDLPEWAMWVDCQQVGRDPEGRIVAFDYAD